MKCRNCGEEVYDDQKICLNCNAPVKRWDGQATIVAGEEQKPIPWKKIGIASGSGVLAIILLVVIMSFKVTPPDQITQKWLNAVESRNMKSAQQYTTTQFEVGSVGYSCKSEERSDEIISFVTDNAADFTLSKPEYDSAKNPKSAKIIATFKGNNDAQMLEHVTLIKQGRQWKIEKVDQAGW